MNSKIKKLVGKLQNSAERVARGARSASHNVAFSVREREEQKIGISELACSVDPFSILPLPSYVVNKSAFYEFVYSGGFGKRPVIKPHRLERGTSQYEILHLATVDITNFEECKAALGKDPGVIDRVIVDEHKKSVSFTFSGHKGMDG